MQRFLFSFCLLFCVLIFSPDGACFTDINKLSFNGFDLGMSYEEAIKNLERSGYKENENVGTAQDKGYTINSCSKNDIPCSTIIAKSDDNSEYIMQFVDGALVILVWKKKNHKINVKKATLLKNYYNMFGKPDSGGEEHSGNEITTHLVWGGEATGPGFNTMFPHIKVEIKYHKDEEKRKILLFEQIRIVDFFKLMGFKYSDSIEHYKKGLLRFKSKQGNQ